MSFCKNTTTRLALALVVGLCVSDAQAADTPFGNFAPDSAPPRRNVTGTTEGSNNALDAPTDVTTQGPRAVSHGQEPPPSSTIKAYKVNPATGKLELMDVPVNTNSR